MRNEQEFISLNALIVATGQLNTTTQYTDLSYAVTISFMTLFNIALIFVAVSSIFILSDLQNTCNNMFS